MQIRLTTLLRKSNATSIGVLLFTLFVLPATLYAAHSFNHYQQTSKINSDTQSIFRDINERLNAIRTLMSSLVALNDVLPEFDKRTLQLFSKHVFQNDTYITALGRFDRVNGDERSSFESRLSGKENTKLQIHQFTELGDEARRPESDWYYPISMLEPMSPHNKLLLGADLGSATGFSEIIHTNTVNSDPVFTTLPTSWPRGVSLIALQTINSNDFTPGDNGEQLSKPVGGFWAYIDLQKLLANASDQWSSYDLNVEIVSGNKRKVLYKKLAAPNSAGFLTSLYQTNSVKQRFNAGHDRYLVVTFEQAIGFSVKALITIMIMIVISVVALFSTILFITARTASTDQSVNVQEQEKDLLLEDRKNAEKTLNSVQDAIITLDTNFRIAHINPAASIQFNIKASLAIGSKLSRMMQFQEVDSNFENFNIPAALANIEHNSKGEFDVVPTGCSHDDFVLRLTLSSSRTPEGKTDGHVLVFRDVSHERRLTNKLAYQANHDALTGCTNRYFFENKLATLIDEQPFNNQTHALCYMDLDQFKIVNDTCGHRAGDRLLQELTENMLTGIRQSDVLSRLGGDEFGLLIVDATPETAIEISERIYKFFQNYVFHHEDKAFAVRASIGMVHIDESSGQLKDILAAADIACYAAKDSGRNNLSIYSKTDENMAERSVELSWLPRLQNALQKNEFRLHVQAVAKLKPESNIAHFEFLLRLANPDGSDSTPWQFIQAAERYDLMRDIDKWVIKNALRTVAELKGQPGGNCSFSINLSGQSAADPTLKVFIQEQLAHYDVNPAQIWFELTETAAISHFSVAVDLIKSIRSFGSKVALDDFGSGLSSFGYLKNLAVDVIKIDGQFVREIANNSIDREMVRAIHQVGKSMGIETVAEFVESQEIVDELIKIGIDYAQGYHIGKPGPIGDAMSQVPGLYKAS
ncbi:MAG: EAL domain-containing protein [Granulosicoccus sp.]